jgi:hypothetical protein
MACSTHDEGKIFFTFSNTAAEDTNLEVIGSKRCVIIFRSELLAVYDFDLSPSLPNVLPERRSKTQQVCLTWHCD